MHLEDSPGYSRLPVTKHTLVTTNDSVGFPLATGTVRACTTMHAQPLYQAISHRQAQQFTITTFATSKAATVSHTGKHRTGAACVASQAVHKESPQTTLTWSSPCNSAFHANLRLLCSLLIISLSCLNIHSTTTVQGYCYNTRLLRPALTVSTNFRQPRVKRTFCLSS